MNLLSIYLGSMNDFTRQFQNNEVLYNQARAYWNKLDDLTIVFIPILLVAGIGMAYWYYKPFNNKPGRHYRPKYWWYFGGGAALLSVVLTSMFGYALAYPKLNGASGLLVQIVCINALYAAFVYIVISLIWCNYMPTNAYRYLCFRKNKS